MYKKVVSFGGNQSNHMVAVAQMAKDFRLDFDYITPPIPKKIKDSPSGNLKVYMSNKEASLT